jgi:hypothetical protein
VTGRVSWTYVIMYPSFVARGVPKKVTQAPPALTQTQEAETMTDRWTWGWLVLYVGCVMFLAGYFTGEVQARRAISAEQKEISINRRLLALEKATVPHVVERK